MPSLQLFLVRREIRQLPHIDNVVTSSAFLSPLQKSDLFSVISSFKPSKSPGVNGIRLSDLRRNYGSLKTVLLFMLNSFIEAKFIPNDLKMSIVSPLYKGGAKHNIKKIIDLFLYCQSSRTYLKSTYIV